MVGARSVSLTFGKLPQMGDRHQAWIGCKPHFLAVAHPVTGVLSWGTLIPLYLLDELRVYVIIVLLSTMLGGLHMHFVTSNRGVDE